MDQAAQEGAGGEHHGGAGQGAAVGEDEAAEAPPGVEGEILAGPGDHGQPRGRGDRRLHGGRVELPVGLGAGAAHRRALAAVEQAELDAGGVRHTAHQPVQGIDLADEVALAQAADRRIARHGADRGRVVGDQRGARAAARRGGRGLDAGMATADDGDVEPVGCGVGHRVTSSLSLSVRSGVRGGAGRATRREGAPGRTDCGRSKRARTRRSTRRSAA